SCVRNALAQCASNEPQAQRPRATAHVAAQWRLLSHQSYTSARPAVRCSAYLGPLPKSVVYRDANLTRRSWLEAPSSEGSEGSMVKHRMPGALFHVCVDDVSSFWVYLEHRNPAASEALLASFDRVIWSRR